MNDFSSKGTHEYVDDPRNDDILVSVNGELVHRDKAVVSVFDSGYVLGDGAWEGLRVVDGKVAFLSQHLRRLGEGLKALDIDLGIAKDELRDRIFAVLEANGQAAPGTEGVHIRLMVTRGKKRTPYQDPRVTVGSATVVIIPEWKQPKPEALKRGMRLFTVHVRRGYPDVQDNKINSHSKINCILACIQATKAGYDEALMLDPHGFVATCNSTHFFIVRDGELWTSTGEFCLGGITRGNILRAARENGIVAREKSFSLYDVYSADEAFVTGTFAGLTPVVEADGRSIGTYERADEADASGPVTRRLRELYKGLQRAEAEGRTAA
jgi:branched-chain amino acid aminotransferase